MHLVAPISGAVAALVARVRQVHAPAGVATTVIAIDGYGGSGKTSLAATLADELGGVPVVHTDDFVTPEDYFGWGPQFLTAVLEPIARGAAASYQPYRWVEQCFGPEVTVAGGGTVIVEGVSSSRVAFRPYLALVVWVDAPRHVRLARGLRRDGRAARAFWHDWMAAEARFFAHEDLRALADVRIDGTLPYVVEEPRAKR